MAVPEKTCVSCGERFALLRTKPGFANKCPQCSAPPIESKVIQRRATAKKHKTTNELVADAERKVYPSRRLIDLVSGKTNRPGGR